MSENDAQLQTLLEDLPGLDCGICGYRTCAEFAKVLKQTPEEIKRCTNIGTKSHVSGRVAGGGPQEKTMLASGRNCGALEQPRTTSAPCSAPAGRAPQACNACDLAEMVERTGWKDSLDREFDFILDTFPNEPGPRETILPHNPQLTKELNITRGDIMIGRPLGMSCGCPITHCGVVTDVDQRTGVIVWCVTGPLGPRAKPHKDIGFYSAEAYEGLVRDTQSELKIGMRYWFLPRRCMLQWRHSGLINFMNKTKDGTQIRIEGLLIG